MPTKPPPIDRPTRRTIDELFKSLLYNRDRYDVEYDALSAQMRELEERLLDTPQMRALKRRKDAAWTKAKRRERRNAELVRAVRDKYLAYGLTPAVERAIKELVKKVNAK